MSQRKGEVTPDRRRLIKTAGAWCLVGPAQGFAAASAVEPDSAGVADRLCHLLGNNASMLEVGRSVLRSGCLRHGEQALTSAVLHQLGLTATRLLRIDRQQLAKRLQAQLHLDFESGDMVDVEGWQLSRIEAQVSALVALRVGERL
jgi:hypothetical protein